MSPPGRSLGRLVGRSVGSGRAFDFLCWWCSVWGRLRGLGLWVSLSPDIGFYGRPAFVRVSSSVMGAVCACLLARHLRRVAPRFSCPGLFVCLVLARARCGIAGGSTRLLAVITRVPPRLAVRCALFSVFVGVGCFSGDNKIGRLFGGASLWGFAFGLRLRARPTPRLDAEPVGHACGGSRIRACPTKHRRHTAVVFTTKRRRRAVCWRASCCICGDRPRPHTESGFPSVALLIVNYCYRVLLRNNNNKTI